MLATTKQARKLVHALCTVYKHSYTDVSASKRKTGTNLRNITFCTQYSTAQQQAQQLREAMFLCGYTNKVKLTLGKYSYLRINNCVLEV
jgi:hypothetical protein